MIKTDQELNDNFLTIMQELIITEEEYRKAIVRFLDICDSEPGTSEYEEAIFLSSLMEKYENLSVYERLKIN